MSSTKRPVRSEVEFAEACEAAGIGVLDAAGPGRTEPVAKSRAVVADLLRRCFGWSARDVGAALNRSSRHVVRMINSRARKRL